MDKKSKFLNFFKSFYNWYLIVLTVLVSLPVLAPILYHLGFTGPASVIYFIYSFFCHQFASRSIHVYDYQFAWCARDTGIWIGIWLIALLIKLKKVKGIKWYWVIPFVIPIALDGGLQTIFTFLNIQPNGDLLNSPLYLSNNLMRFMTGSFFGIGLSLWISWQLFNEEPKNVNNREDEKSKLEIVKSHLVEVIKLSLPKVVVPFIIAIIIYIGFVSIWFATSSKIKPIDALDSAPKASLSTFFARREDGICPTKGVEDLFAFDCFFKN